MLEGFSSNDIECETKAEIEFEFFFLKLEVVSLDARAFFSSISVRIQGVRGACVKMGEDRRGHISLISLLY